MTAKGHFQAPAQGMAVNGGNDWFQGGFKSLDNVGQDRVHWRFAKFRYVSPGDKCFPRTDQNGDLNRGISINLIKGRDDVLPNTVTGGVDRRIVDGDNGNVVFSA